VYLAKLKLTNFRNYENQSLDLSAGLNCFVGMNGMGKTNLLDAVYYLCMCKSHFGVNDRNVLLHAAEFFRIEGQFKRKEKKEKIVAKVIPGKKKEFERNAVPYKRLMEHIGLLPVVIIVPDDTQLATEGSEARRRFLDNTLSQLDPDYLKHLVTYNKLLKQRNATLKQFAAERSFNSALLETYNMQMEEAANLIHQKRQTFLERFLPVFTDYYKVISEERETVDLHYKSQLNDQDFLMLMKAAEEKDRILQRTTTGIHKDDIVFRIGKFPLKRFASQGQLKSFILALKLGQYELLRIEKKIDPILLLDDIFDKLDNMRVKQLIGLLHDRSFGQVFITDTHESRVGDIIKDYDADFKKFIIENGVANLS